MNKWQVTGVTSAGIVMVAVLAAFLYSSDYSKVLSQNPGKNVFLLDYSQTERAEFLLRSVSSCPHYIIRIDRTNLAVKCGSRIKIVTDTIVGSNVVKWVNLTRNLSSVSVEATQTGKVMRTTSFLKSGQLNGVLTELFEISQQKIKISHLYAPIGSEPHRVGWRVKKDFGASLSLSDPLYVGQAGNVYWYGEKTGVLETDPAVILADSNLTYYVWNGSTWFNVTNATAVNYVRFQCRPGSVNCEPVFINKSSGLNATAGQNASFNKSIFLINNTGSIDVSYVQLRLNKSCSFVNFTISNQTGGGSKRNLSTGFVNVSGLLLVNATNSTIPLYIFANVSSNITTGANNTIVPCPPLNLTWEVR